MYGAGGEYAGVTRNYRCMLPAATENNLVEAHRAALMTTGGKSAAHLSDRSPIRADQTALREKRIGFVLFGKQDAAPAGCSSVKAAYARRASANSVLAGVAAASEE